MWIAALLCVSALVAGEETKKLFVIGDFHLDPYYGGSHAVGPCISSSTSPKYGAYKCDSPWKIVELVVDDVVARAQQFDNATILVTGDWVRHNMKDLKKHLGSKAAEIALAESIISRIATRFATQANATVPVVLHPNLFSVTLGNEDFVPHYHFNETHAKHPLLDTVTTSLENLGIFSKAESNTFRKCGYFAREFPDKLFVLSFNSVIYSVQHSPHSEKNNTDPCGQFKWMDRVLNHVKNVSGSAHLVSHIFPEVGKWHPHYEKSFRAVMKRFKDVVRAGWFGHIHMFQYLALKRDKDPPTFSCPAITQVDGNQPAYLEVTLNANHHVVNIIERTFDSSTAKWTHGRSLSDFGLSPPTSSALYNFGVSLLSADKSNTTWRHFEDMYRGGAVTSLGRMGNTEKNKMVCSMITDSVSSYERCRSEHVV